MHVKAFILKQPLYSFNLYDPSAIVFYTFCCASWVLSFYLKTFSYWYARIFYLVFIMSCKFLSSWQHVFYCEWHDLIFCEVVLVSIFLYEFFLYFSLWMCSPPQGKINIYIFFWIFLKQQIPCLIWNYFSVWESNLIFSN